MLAAVLLAAPLVGCRVELGECDEAAAREVVFLDTGNAASSLNGIPMYAGQGLTHVTCGNGQFCHSREASPIERYGVPAGLDFDVQYACDEGPCDASADATGIERLAAGQAEILDDARSILTTVRNGRMPPGGVGDRIVEQAGRFRRIEPAARTRSFTLSTQELPCTHPLTSCAEGETTQVVETQFLPAVGTAEGNDILRNWLACGAPVVESTRAPDEDEIPGTPCQDGSGAGQVGDCLFRIPPAIEPPEPTWTSIYTEVIGPLCGESCHAGPPFPLDLSTQQVAYDNVVGEVAKGAACEGVGVLVVPNDSASSLFIDKLTRDPICGGPMPSRAGVLPNEVVDVIRAWVDAGAPND